MTEFSEIQISFIKPKDGLIGFASLVLNGAFYLSSIGIHSKLDGSGHRLTYPTRKTGEQHVHLFHPINKTTAKQIEHAVLAKLNEVMDKRNDRYCSFDDGKYAI